MENLLNLEENWCQLLPVIIFLLLWELTWKFIALWRAGRNNDLPWFICIAVFNTAGILPIIYLVVQKRNMKK